MYRLMIGLSITLGIAVASFALGKKKVPANIIFLSVILELMLTIYLAIVTSYLLSGTKGYGLNGTGGAVGMILGAFIFSKITPKYKDAFLGAYVLALPLMYGLGKIGCSFAGCCGGISYNGPFHISTDHGNAFPIQALEAAVFLGLFVASAIIYVRDCSNSASAAKDSLNAISTGVIHAKVRFNPVVAAIIYSIVKVLLDFLRETHNEKMITTNQIMCLSVAIILALVLRFRKPA